MRLIDADALRDYLDKRRTYEIMDGRNKAYGKGVRDAMKDLEDAPAIDAIPVEWMIDRATDPERAPLYRRYAQMLIEEWQKEREVQDAKM